MLAPAERLDVLIDLTGLPDGARLHLVNSAPAPFGGGAVPTVAELETLLHEGDEANLNPFPWVLCFDVDPDAATPGRPGSLLEALGEEVLNPRFRRLVHDLTDPLPTGEAVELSVEGHEHRIILLAETDPPGHLYLQEIVADPFGDIELQLPGDPLPRRYRVEGWMADDHSPSSSRVSFYDRIALRPQLGRWQVWRFVNATADTHPLHIHQSQFQPLDDVGGLLDVTAGPDGPSLYDPTFRHTLAPIRVSATPDGRRFEPPETHGWKDVIRIDPGNVVKVAVRFDVPGRFVYHCHVLEREDTEMMRALRRHRHRHERHGHEPRHVIRDGRVVSRETPILSSSTRGRSTRRGIRSPDPGDRAGPATVAGRPAGRPARSRRGSLSGSRRTGRACAPSRSCCSGRARASPG